MHRNGFGEAVIITALSIRVPHFNVVVNQFQNKAIEYLNTRYLKLQNWGDQMYLDELDGATEEDFYRKHVKEWREDQNRLQKQINKNQKADEYYIEQGIQLIEIARNAYLLFQSKSKPE
jgi:site-specific DNA recombinase